MTAFDIGPLYVIGAYRDNEVDQAHPLHLILQHTAEAGVNLTRISLGPLTQADVSRLLSDTVHRPVGQVAPLAQLVFEKTGGNPFFSREFIKALYEDELLFFSAPPAAPTGAESNGDGAGWQWDTDRIKARAMTDNVVELLVDKIRRLPSETQAMVQLAACIGNQFELQILAIVADKSPQAAAALNRSLQEGLILPLDDGYKYISVLDQSDQVEVGYKFAHDRIQQAGYSLIPLEERQAVHWRIGQLLLERISPDQQEERLFNIVHHLNLGIALLDDRPDAETFAGQLAALNLRAGERAIAATAYGSALAYLQAGLSFLPANRWQLYYDLTLRLYIGASQAGYLAGDFDLMRQYAEIVRQYAQTPLDKMAIYQIEIEFYIGQSRLREAVETALQALDICGVTIPPQPDQADVTRRLHEVEALLAGLGQTQATQLEQLLNRPKLTDPTKLATLDILTRAALSSYYRDPNLMAVTTLEAVKLAIQDGHSPATPNLFNFFAILLCIQLGDIETGYQFSQLALQLQDRYGIAASRARVLCNAGMVQVWKEHIGHTLPTLLEAHQIGLETGDLLYASIAVQIYCVRSLLVGRNLIDLAQDMATYGLFMARQQQTHNLYYHRVFWQLVLNLRGQAPIAWELKGAQADEVMRREMNDAGFSIGVATWHLGQLILSYLFQQWPSAYNQATAGTNYYDTTSTTIDDVLFYFYASLAQLAVYSNVAETEQQHILEKVATVQQKLKFWADHAPMNFRHKYLLVEAERARVSGQAGQARELYDRAIELAHEHGYIHEAALANEVTARFYQAQGRLKIAQLYLREAHYAYQQWGAVAKVEHLEQRYPELFAPANLDLRHTSLTTPALTQRAADQLDLNSVLKASQALSGEIVLDRLLTTLMHLLIENAGAQIGYLILPQADEWWIEAAGSIEPGRQASFEAVPLSVAAYGQAPILSAAIVNYVARTQESVVLNDATGKGQFVRDPYIMARQPKSVLSAPLLHQGQVAGILYLENNLTHGAFTPDRLEILSLLSSQAAISIENARLYTDLQSSEVKYRTIFETSNDVIYLATPTGQIVDINQAGLNLLGYSKAELIEHQTRDFYVQPAAYANFQRRLENDGLVKDFETRYRKKNGQVITCLETATVRQAEDGTLLGYQGIIRDVTALKQAEHERLRLIAIERDLTLAQDIQQNLLALPEPNWPELDVVCYSIPAREMGGDFYAYYTFDKDQPADPAQPHFVLGVGDVTDKGIPAALLMAISLSSFRSIVGQVPTPAELLAQLDEAIIDYTRASRQNCALVYIGLDRTCTTLHAANAGCIAPFIKRSQGQVEQIDVGGIPLGIGLGAEFGYRQVSLKIGPGDIIVLTSDGVIEARNETGQMFGFERWATTIKTGPTHSAAALLDHLRQTVIDFMGAVEQHDDITIVVARV